MTEERTPVLIYAGSEDGRYRSGVPRRDLYAEDVARLPPAVLKEITGGEHPLYRAVGDDKSPKAKSPKPAEAEAAPDEEG